MAFTNHTMAMALTNHNHGPDAESKSDVRDKSIKRTKHLHIKEKIFFVITIQSIPMCRFDNLYRPTQAQIFYNKSRFTKKNYQFYE